MPPTTLYVEGVSPFVFLRAAADSNLNSSDSSMATIHLSVFNRNLFVLLSGKDTMAEELNTGAEDLNQERSLGDTNPRTADSVGKTFLRNVKEKWNNVPQGWAQMRTNSVDTDSTVVEEDVPSPAHEDSTPGGEETQ
jgi:hypothetical protein